MQLGAIVAGVGEYLYTEPEFSDPPTRLKYAADDARLVAKYLQTCWAEDSRTIIELYEQDVSLDGIDTAFRDLSAKRSFDTLIIFLSGHGIIDAGDAGFLVQPTPHTSHQFSILEANSLNSLIASCSAKQTILVLDCCYAGAITAQLPHFMQLGKNDTARLFIGSSRADQVTWEDEMIGQGIFTAHLLDLLNTGDAEALDGRRAELDVDAELFPILCEQVPLYALKHKAAQQEPLKGGLSSTPIFLPTVNATKSLRSNTVFSTAVRRFRQFVAATGFSLIVFLVAAFALTYHIEPIENGMLAVKRGPRWLEPIFRLFPATRVETRLSILEFSPDPERSRQLQSGYASGVWLHKNSSGYREWADNALTGLNESSAFQYRALLGDRPTDDEVWSLKNEVASGELLLRTWSLIGTDGVSLPVLLKRIPGSDLYHELNEPFSQNKINYGILDLTTGQMLNYAAALEYAFIVDHQLTWLHYLGFAKAASEWLYLTSEQTRGRGSHDQVRSAIGKGLVRLINVRIDNALKPLSDDMIDQLLALHASSYSDSLRVAFSRSGVSNLLDIARGRATREFSGNPVEPFQERALLSLIYSLDPSESAKTLVDAALAKFDQTGSLNNSYYTRLLIEAGASGSLSAKQLSRLVAQAHTSLKKSERDFEDLELARILAFAMGQISLKDRQVAYKLIAKIVSEEPPSLSFVSQIYAALAEQNLDKPYMLHQVREQVRSASTEYNHVKDSAESQPGMMVLVSSDPWISTLVSFALSRKLDPEDYSLLVKHLENPNLRESISRSIVVHSQHIDSKNAAAQIFRDLEGAATNFSERKKLETLNSHALANLKLNDFEREIKQLILLRTTTEEPELRTSIGQIIIDARLSRTRPDSVGLPLLR